MKQVTKALALCSVLFISTAQAEETVCLPSTTSAKVVHLAKGEETLFVEAVIDPRTSANVTILQKVVGALKQDGWSEAPTRSVQENLANDSWCRVEISAPDWVYLMCYTPGFGESWSIRRKVPMNDEGAALATLSERLRKAQADHRIVLSRLAP